MPAIYDHALKVPPEAIDVLGHVNNLEYLRWALEAALAHSAAQGWPADAYQKLRAGFVVRAHEIKYLQSAFAGDDVVVRTWIADFKRLSCVRRYRMVRPRDGAVLVTASTEWAFINFDTGALARIPPEIASAFEIVPEGPDA